VASKATGLIVARNVFGISLDLFLPQLGIVQSDCRVEELNGDQLSRVQGIGDNLDVVYSVEGQHCA
jgi:hypothetical protein